MLFVPKKWKFRKKQKGKKLNTINKVYTSETLIYNKLGLKAKETGHMSSKQITALRQTVNKIMKKKGKVRIKIFPTIQFTKKPLEVRMGKGKGNIDRWVFKVRSGTMLCEIETPFPLIGLKALKLAKFKIPLNTILINRI